MSNITTEVMNVRMMSLMGSGGGSSKLLRGTDKMFWVKGDTPLKTQGFWPIRFLPIDNLTSFLDFSFLFLILLYFSSSEFYRGWTSSSLEILGGTHPAICANGT